MCTIKEVNRKGIMEMDRYAIILEKFRRRAKDIRFVTLHGMGEPLLDRELPKKIALAKEYGFNGIGFATNATNLTSLLSEELIDAGLDTIIFSVDGIKKETHEFIRKGADYDRIIENIHNFIKVRNERGRTKIIIRMIRQDRNRLEWEDYKRYWRKALKPEFGDEVACFDVHNWGVRNDGLRRERELKELSRNLRIICHDLIERFIIFIDGNIGLCCGDEKGVFNLGNIYRADPEEIYNNEIFNYFRKMMQEGRLAEIDYCKNCQIILSRMKRQYVPV